MFMHLGVWFFFGYIIHMFVDRLNKSSFRFSASARLLHGRAGLADRVRRHLFMFAKQQDRIDREHGFAEDD